MSIEAWKSRMAQCSLPCIVVYDHPKDFPDAFVARLFDGEQPTQVHAQADTLDALYTQLPLHGLVRIPRYKQDDPVILEAWI